MRVHRVQQLRGERKKGVRGAMAWICACKLGRASCAVMQIQTSGSDGVRLVTHLLDLSDVQVPFPTAVQAGQQGC